jgi:hypothetical protein
VTVTTLLLSCTARSNAVPSAVTVPCGVCTWNGQRIGGYLEPGLAVLQLQLAALRIDADMHFAAG